MGQEHGDGVLAHPAAELGHPPVGLGLYPACAEGLQEEVTGDAQFRGYDPVCSGLGGGGHAAFHEAAVEFDVSGNGRNVKQGNPHAAPPWIRMPGYQCSPVNYSTELALTPGTPMARGFSLRHVSGAFEHAGRAEHRLGAAPAQEAKSAMVCLDARCLEKDNEIAETTMPRGVVVARQPLELKSLVRAQAGQPTITGHTVHICVHPLDRRFPCQTADADALMPCRCWIHG